MRTACTGSSMPQTRWTAPIIAVGFQKPKALYHRHYSVANHGTSQVVP